MDLSIDKFRAVDEFLCDTLVGRDAALEHALQTSAAADLPAIAVAPNQGKLLHVFAKSIGAKRILEIGTLGGYSTIWLARAIAEQPGAKLITLEYEPKHAEIATKNIANAGLSKVVEVIVGAALDSLPKLIAQNAGPFDLVFIDADKVNTPRYFEFALKLTRRGGLIIVDNVVRSGNIVDQSSTDSGVKGTREFLTAAAKNPAVTVTAVQTVGSKGYDGFAIAVVN